MGGKAELGSQRAARRRSCDDSHDFRIVEPSHLIEEAEHRQPTVAILLLQLAAELFDLAQLHEAETIHPALRHALRHWARNTRVLKLGCHPSLERLRAAGNNNQRQQGERAVHRWTDTIILST